MIRYIATAVLLMFAVVQLSAQTTKITWAAGNAKLLAKSTTLLVEYNSVDNKSGGTHKYKLFDVAFGTVVLETNGRSFFGQGSTFIIIDDKFISVYNIAAAKATVTAKFNVSDISKTTYKDIEFVGLSKKNNPIFKLVGSETSSYYIFNMASKTTRKMATPADFYKSIYMPQSGEFVYLTQGGGKHVCYSYNPEDDKVLMKGTISSVPDEKIYRVQLSPDGNHAIYGGKYVYDMKASKMLYQLPVSNQDINWTNSSMQYSGQKVSADFSVKGDSIIIIKRLKENMASTEKVQIEIYDTVSDKSIKSFFFNYKGDIMADADVPSGWAAFVKDGKVKIVHLTSKNVTREFSLLSTDDNNTLFNSTGMLPGADNGTK
jgi:hypothetical protein